MKLAQHDIGVCSWSLRPRDLSDLIESLGKLRLHHVQLALAGLITLPEDEARAQIDRLRNAHIALTATMISFEGEDYSTIASIKRSGGYVPDDLWPARRDATLAAARLAKSAGVSLLSTHVGFVPPPSDPTYSVVLQRIAEVCKRLAEMGVELLMETGQESASELLQFIHDLNQRNIGVNFDPANMILYGAGDPIEAIHTLGKHIRHVHIKDARASHQPGVEWGSEVAFGQGQVPHDAFIRALHKIHYAGPLVIEREAGEQRLDDVAYAVTTLTKLLG
jgi:sugar phosphate isomerase/epimerase